ncbi:MAG: hypothetical protein QM796_00885 [Chthoniobacteraceae bacterium]
MLFPKINEAYIEPVHRAVSVITIFQMGVVIAGTCFVFFTMKGYGYGTDEMPETAFRSGALFVRHYGFCLMSFPVIWAATGLWMIHCTFSNWMIAAFLLLGTGAGLWGIWEYIMIGFRPAFTFIR